MTGGTVLLIFSGLIAFAPVGQPGTLTAFLLRSDNHAPTLTVRLNQVDSCPASCSARKAYCICRLEGAFVLDPAPMPATKGLQLKPAGVLPDSSTSSGDGWLVHMKNVDGLFAKLDKGLIAANVVAQGSFGWEEALTCAFDEDEENGERRAYAFKFITRGNVAHEQAAAEAIVFKSGVRSEQLKISLPASSVELNVKCGGSGCPIWIENAPHEIVLCDKCSLCAHAGHFDEYNKLTGGGLGSRHVFRQCGKSSKLGNYGSGICSFVFDGPSDAKLSDESFKHDGSMGYFAVSNRVICPMVVLEP